jgi:hypothetical protein
MEYQVPQFIEVESKIVGPLTLAQFVYIAGAAGLCVVFYFYLPLIFALLFAAPVVGLAAALAFYRVNGKPFIQVLESAFNYYTSSHLFIWKHAQPTAAAQKEAQAVSARAEALAHPVLGAPRLTRDKLSELAWQLDVNKPRSSLS